MLLPFAAAFKFTSPKPEGGRGAKEKAKDKKKQKKQQDYLSRFFFFCVCSQPINTTSRSCKQPTTSVLSSIASAHRRPFYS